MRRMSEKLIVLAERGEDSRIGERDARGGLSLWLSPLAACGACMRVNPSTREILGFRTGFYPP
eukprot:330728-Prymnesium_polylepis.1